MASRTASSVHLEDSDAGPGRLLLFVVTEPDVTLTEELSTTIRQRLRSELSPRHVPDDVVAVPIVPRNIAGKKLEVPAKRVLQGARIADVAAVDALNDPQALDPFVDLVSTPKPSTTRK